MGPPPRAVFAAFAVLLALVLLTLGSPPPTTAQSPAILGPYIDAPIRPASSARGLRARPQRAFLTPAESPRPVRRSAAPPALTLPRARAGEPAQSQRALGSNLPPPFISFEGLGLAAGGGYFPPDPNGDVGPNHYVQAVNIAIGVFDKTGALVSTSTFDDLFDGTGTPCDNNNRGDPIALYDGLADRWLVSDMAWSPGYTAPSYECIAVSKTADPVLGGWWLYALRTGETVLDDYPKLGVWSDGYYLSSNMMTPFSYIFTGVRVWALPREPMLRGLPITPISFDLPCSREPCAFSLLPSTLRGALPPSGAPDFFASIDQPDQLHLWKFHADWANPGASTFTGPVNLTVTPFVMPCDAANLLACVPTRSGERLDALGDRLMMPLQYRNLGGIESLWVNHTIAGSSAPNTPTWIRWYEIRNPNAAPSIHQEGNWQPDSNYRWMGSLAVNRLGDMALGYSVAGSTLNPAIRYAGRLGTDPLGTLGQGETSLVEGTGAQSGDRNRWGDYSAMMVDPVDDCTFWYTNEYYTTIGLNWQTRIGAFRSPNCAAPSPPVPTETPAAKPTQVVRCEDAYEPDDTPALAHALTTPQLHNFSSPADQDWVFFSVKSNWVYHIRAAPPANYPTEPHLALYVNGNEVAANDHYFGNSAEIWWWNTLGDQTAYVRVTELQGRADCGNSQYTLSVEGMKDKP